MKTYLAFLVTIFAIASINISHMIKVNELNRTMLNEKITRTTQLVQDVSYDIHHQ